VSRVVVNRGAGPNHHGGGGNAKRGSGRGRTRRFRTERRAEERRQRREGERTVRAKPDEQEAVRAKPDKQKAEADERMVEGIGEDQAAERAEKAFAGQAWSEGAERPVGGPVGAFQRHWRAWERLPTATEQVRAWARDGYYV
jgi:hypothetical protein